MRCYRLQMGKLRLREARDASEIPQRLECPETKSGGRVCVCVGGDLSLDVRVGGGRTIQESGCRGASRVDKRGGGSRGEQHSPGVDGMCLYLFQI